MSVPNVPNYVRSPIRRPIKKSGKRTGKKSEMVYVKSALGNVYAPRFSARVKLEDGETLDTRNWVINGNETKTRILQSIRDALDRSNAALLMVGRDFIARDVYEMAFPKVKSKAKSKREQRKIERLNDAINHLLAQTEQEFGLGEITYDNARKQRGHAGYIVEWAKSHFSRENVLLSDIVPGHLKSLQLWLKSEKGLSANYASYISKYFKRVMAHSVAYGFADRNPFATIIIKMDPVRGEHLTADELAKLTRFDASIISPHAVLALDCFLWQCYTGCSYSDGVALTEANILRQDDGTLYLKYQRGKVKRKGAGHAIVPLLPEAFALLEKYRTHPLRVKEGRLIPGRSYDKTNKSLGLIAKLARVTKRVTTHTARRTFATNFINAGVDLAVVSKMLGHSATSITEKSYAELRPDGIIREMRAFITPKTA